MAGLITASISVQSTGGPDPKARRVGVAYTNAISQLIQVTTGTTDSSLAFGGVTTGDVFYLVADQQIKYRFNTNTGTQVTVPANRPVFLAGSNITAVYISNSSGSTANVEYLVAGA